MRLGKRIPILLWTTKNIGRLPNSMQTEGSFLIESTMLVPAECNGQWNDLIVLVAERHDRGDMDDTARAFHRLFESVFNVHVWDLTRYEVACTVRLFKVLL